MEIKRLIFPPDGDEDKVRAAVVAEAKTWVNTPYNHWQSLKGAGVDCGHLMMACYRAAGFDFRDLKIHYFSPQWFQSANAEETLLTAGLHFAVEVPTPEERRPQPADIVLLRLKSQVYNHSALVTDWPNVIHARPPGRLARGWVEKGKIGEDVLRSKHIKILSPWG